MKRLVRSNFQPITASHLFVSDAATKEMLSSDLFAFMNDAYKWIGGFKSFTDEDDFASKSYLWYITYKGSLPKRNEAIDINKVYTVSVFKHKHGLKLVGIGNNRFLGVPDPERKELKVEAADAMISHIQFVVTKGWAEVSGAAEAMFKRAVSPRWIIDPEYLITIPGFEDIQILPDNLHYIRTLSNGMEVTKIAYGTINFN